MKQVSNEHAKERRTRNKNGEQQATNQINPTEKRNKMSAQEDEARHEEAKVKVKTKGKSINWRTSSINWTMKSINLVFFKPSTWKFVIKNETS